MKNSGEAMDGSKFFRCLVGLPAVRTDYVRGYSLDYLTNDRELKKMCYLRLWGVGGASLWVLHGGPSRCVKPPIDKSVQDGLG